MSVDHYENFPVASWLLPARLREPVRAIYNFARSADDIADEGTLSDAERLSGLARYRTELDAIEAGRPRWIRFSGACSRLSLNTSCHFLCFAICSTPSARTW
ncbi:MAG: squalene/phytoene synthase family protein [Rhodocyclaceae bacterium]|nr:squalene/phytoene synthase family protein [Rhodocyclaceae bacterium]